LQFVVWKAVHLSDKLFVVPALHKQKRRAGYEQFEREKKYRASAAITKALLSRGFISEKEYGKIDTILIAKYRPVLGSLRAKLT